MGHPCNPSTQEGKAQRSNVQGLPGLHGETLSQKTSLTCETPGFNT